MQHFQLKDSFVTIKTTLLLWSRAQGQMKLLQLSQELVANKGGIKLQKKVLLEDKWELSWGRSKTNTNTNQ